MAKSFRQICHPPNKTGGNRLPLKLVKTGLIVALLLMVNEVIAQQRILLVQSSAEPVYQQFAQAVREKINTLKEKPELQIITVDEFSQQPIPPDVRADYLIAAGIRASQFVAGLNSKKPQLLALIPTTFYESHIKTHKIRCLPGLCSVILLDQPIERQLKLLHMALPEHRRVLFLSSPQTSALLPQLIRLSLPLGINIQHIPITSDKSLIQQLTGEMTAGDVVLALPDPNTYNRDTARPLLLATYKYGVPLVAYSPAFIDAGAALGIYTTPEQFARQCVELIAKNPLPATTVWPMATPPKYYTIAINSAVVESLGIKIPAVAYLYDQLEREQP